MFSNTVRAAKIDLQHVEQRLDEVETERTQLKHQQRQLRLFIKKITGKDVDTVLAQTDLFEDEAAIDE